MWERPTASPTHRKPSARLTLLAVGGSVVAGVLIGRRERPGLDRASSFSVDQSLVPPRGAGVSRNFRHSEGRGSARGNPEIRGGPAPSALTGTLAKEAAPKGRRDCTYAPWPPARSECGRQLGPVYLRPGAAAPKIGTAPPSARPPTQPTIRFLGPARPRACVRKCVCVRACVFERACERARGCVCERACESV